jgi:AcrR family transcriptional regulator
MAPATRLKQRQRLHPDDRRVLLMAAATRTFARLGYAGARMEDVAAEAGVAKGLLYQHFSSKEALFEALMTDRGAEFTQRLRASWAATEGPDPWAMVDAGLDTFLDEAVDPDTLLNWVEPAQWELVSAFRDQTLAAIVEQFTELAPDLDPAVAWLAAAAFQGSLEAAVLEWRRRGGTDRDYLFGLVRAFALRGLAGLRTYLDLPVPEIPAVATATGAAVKRRRGQRVRRSSRSA